MKALVLTGGAAKGAFQVGALQYLAEHKPDLQFDIIVGVSVGALNGGYLAQFNKKEHQKGVYKLKELWSSLQTKDIYKRWFPFGKLAALWKTSLYNSKPLRNLVDEYIDRKKIKTSGRILHIGSVDMEMGHYVESREHTLEIVDAIKASASFPLFMEPVKIGKNLEFDGAIREMAPLKHALKLGATEIILITTTNFKVGRFTNKEPNTLDVTNRFLKIMHNEVVQNDIETFERINKWICDGHLADNAGKKFVPLTIIKPSGHLVENALEFKQKEIRAMFDAGYKAAAQALESK